MRYSYQFWTSNCITSSPISHHDTFERGKLIQNKFGDIPQIALFMLYDAMQWIDLRVFWWQITVTHTCNVLSNFLPMISIRHYFWDGCFSLSVGSPSANIISTIIYSISVFISMVIIFTVWQFLFAKLTFLVTSVNQNNL